MAWYMRTCCLHNVKYHILGPWGELVPDLHIFIFSYVFSAIFHPDKH